MLRIGDIVPAVINHLAHHLRPPEHILIALFSSGPQLAACMTWLPPEVSHITFPLLPLNPQQCRPGFDLHALPLQTAWHCQKAASALASVKLARRTAAC